MDVFELRDRVTQEYSDYITSFFTIRDRRIDALVKQEFSAGRLWPAPLVQLNPSFEPGMSMAQLIEADYLHPQCADIFRVKYLDKPPGPVFQFHKHQEQAVRFARDGYNYVLTTGTGSGKSLSYITPIVDHVLRAGSGKGIKAVIVYPMNALANSQMGELKKFLDLGYATRPVSFACYTGQESEAEKQKIISQPPDILLTNYVMLEYILVRPKERPLVRTMNQLKFLVLDELHTYRGRQGADVALLVRRLRQACGVSALQMVGTSATLAGQGSWLEQQHEVARIASLLFGAEVRAEHVIGETLRPRTQLGDVDCTSFHASLFAALAKPLPPLRQDFQGHPLARWLESRLGVRWDRETLRLRRCDPRPIGGKGGVAEELAQLIGIELDEASAWVHRALLHQVEDGPFFAYRLHQFLAKGETVFASPEPPHLRHLTLTAQKYAPDSQRSRELFPLAFCRECGQDYTTVFRIERNGALLGFEPRALGDTSKEEDGTAYRRVPGFLLMDLTRSIWPESEDEQIALLPETWLEEKKLKLVVRSGQRAYLPVTETINACGQADAKGTPVLWFTRPFRFCPCCRVAFASRGSDYARLATLGSEGRSTATTITTKAVLGFLKGKQGAALPYEARKLLSFTDNRQDASLQSGHFNDFLQVLQIRRGLYQALAQAPQGLDYASLNLAVFEAMELPYEAYARDSGDKYGRDDVAARFRAVLGYLLFRDLERGWRINSPNLEQCGLLHFHFKELDTLCADQEEWDACHPILAAASPDERFHICRVLLDFMRKELAINAQSLNPTYQESIPRDSQDLTSAWSIAQMETMVFAKWAYAGPEQKETSRRRKRTENRIFISERGGFGRYLRRVHTFKQPLGKVPLLETRQMIEEILGRLARAGILERREGKPPGYQIKAARMIWRLGDGLQRGDDPLRMPSSGIELKPNAYFVALYREREDALYRFFAAEHTAQVHPETRKAREDAFRNADLPLMFCSPTMELGVDIKDLNVVNMRNVPPTPANYAQRSGRAGRSGQPAFVFTYCTSGSPHDSYFFRRPTLMVSGQVKPPRLDLTNEDLVRAHVHAIWLHVAQLELRASLADLLELSGKPPNPTLLPAVSEALNQANYRQRAKDAALAALGPEIEELARQQARSALSWLEEVLSRVPAAFEAACARWRELYVAAWLQSERQGRIVRDASRSAQDHKRARSLRDDAELRLRLLAETNERVNSDFYSYRYFASEGFLPGYNFPRLPITAFLRGRGGQDPEDGDALSRPRFLAISEFGPRAIIYHEGSRYMINRVDIPIGHEGGDPTTGAWQCRDCGYMHPPLDARGIDTCDQCGSVNLFHYTNLFRMANVGTKRRDRINSDEEERTRLGYQLKVGVRFPQRDGKRSSRKGRMLDRAGQPLLSLEYGAAATIWRLSLGWRHSKQDHMGFLLDMERGFWAKDKNSEDVEPEDSLTSAVKRVIPYVEDTRNTLLLELAHPPSLEVMASLQAALKHAMQAYYQIEDRELEVEALPSVNDRRVLLFYESAEGGAGVLRRLLDEKGDLAAVARLALELAHFERVGDEIRDTEQDKTGEHCVAACYDCLLSYYNQPDHRRIDRMLLPELLGPWLQGEIESSPASQPREQVYEQLLRLCESDLERTWLTKLYEEGYHLPDQAQTLLSEALCRPDFLYSDPNQRVAIFVDGPHHRDEHQRLRDEDTDERLYDLGWIPLRFCFDRNWDTLLARYPSCFGRPVQRPEAVALKADVVAEVPFDLEDFEPRWQPLLVRLRRLPSLGIASGEEYLSGGRSIGLSAAELSYGEKRLVLLDASDPDHRALAAHLQSLGKNLFSWGEQGDPYDEVLALLGVDPS